MASAAEQRYTLHGVAADLRDDGRARLDFRPLSLEVHLFPQASGSARAVAGAAEVLVGVTAELAAPPADAPDMGQVLLSIDCGPAASAARLPEYAAAADERLLWLEEALRALFSRESIPEALRTLCIARGTQCWVLRVHAQLLRLDGCPLDLISLAAAAALAATRVPRVSGGGADELGGGKRQRAAGGGKQDLDLDESLDESVPFDCSTLPLYVTLANIGGYAVADATAHERRAAGSTLSLALSPAGRVCALRGGGGFGLHLQLAGEMMQLASQLCAQLHADAKDAIAQALADAEGRRWPAGEGTAPGFLA
ncbi:hypothetical protein AB1Y20_019651 [Prymnesium parvum]|uniref:Ribosomal RNA-processing protein 42 n=1 Tax=Prymnesium parvum TaxID=97485 RepID=A0AB34JV28_PRYPA